jgi:HlyD family secretion protein
MTAKVIERIPGRVPRSPKTWLVIAGVALILVVVGASVARSLHKPATSVKTAVVEQMQFQDDVLLSASVRAVEQEQLVAHFGARLLRYNVAEGDSFAAGQVLAELDAADVERQAREAQAALRVAEAQRDQAYNPSAQDMEQAAAEQAASQAAYDAANGKLERCQFLLDQGAASRAELEAAQAEQANALAALKAASARLAALKNPDPRKLAIADAQAEQARAAAESAASIVERGRLTAPFDGVVLQKIPSEGSYLQPGALVLVVARPGHLQVEADLSEQDIGGIATGQNADVQWSGQPGKTWQATVSRIAPAVTKSSAQSENVIRVYLDFPTNPDGLLSGASVDVTIHRITPHEALLVPNEALLGSGAARTLFVVAGNRAYRREVKAGYANELYTEILSGVNSGDHVVLEPGDLQDGQPVKDTGGEKQ